MSRATYQTTPGGCDYAKVSNTYSSGEVACGRPRKVSWNSQVPQWSYPPACDTLTRGNCCGGHRKYKDGYDDYNCQSGCKNGMNIYKPVDYCSNPARM